MLTLNNAPDTDMPAPPLIKVSIVEDHNQIRESLAVLIGGSSNFKCVSAHRTAEEALEQIPRKKPDVVLMDINLPGMSGIKCVRQLKAAMPSVKIVMHTVYEDEEQLFQSLRSGASGYLLKSTDPAKLLEGIRDVYNGSAAMTGHLARMVVEFFHQKNGGDETGDDLTEREREILNYLARGYRNKEIADALGIGFDTVRTHLQHIYEKLHVQSRTEAVIKFLGNCHSNE